MYASKRRGTEAEHDKQSTEEEEGSDTETTLSIEIETCAVAREGAIILSVSIATVSMCLFYQPAELS